MKLILGLFPVLKRSGAFLALFAGSFLPLHAVGLENLTWTTADGEVTITDCDEVASGALVIPDNIEGNPVTSIGNYAFSNCTSLTNVTIGNGVTSIGDYAFKGCSSLTSITIPDGVTNIGQEAFYFCYSLTSITIPDSVTSIGTYAFFDCTNLTSITFQGAAPTVAGNTFNGVTAGALVTSENQASFGDIGTAWNGLTIALVEELAINRVSLPAGMRLSEGGIMGLIDGNMYMALDNISAQIYNKMYRYDGANFTAVDMPEGGWTLEYESISEVYGGSMYVQLRNSSTNTYNVMYRYDGANFTAVDMPAGGWTLEYSTISEVYGGSMYVQLRNSSANTYNVMYKYDGTNFTAVDMPEGGWTLDYSTISEVYGGSMYVQLRNSSANTYNVMYKYDGTNFTAVDMPEGGWTLEYSTSAEVYGGSMYVHLRNSSANTYNVMYKYDGTNFTAVDMPEGWKLSDPSPLEVYGEDMYVSLDNSSANTYGVLHRYNGQVFMDVDLPEGWKFRNYGGGIDIVANTRGLVGTDSGLYLMMDNSSSSDYRALFRIIDPSVSDQSLPVLTLDGGDVVSIVEGATYTDGAVTAVDFLDGDISDRIIVTGAVDTTQPGTYTITYKVSDNAGNVSTKVRNVIVEEELAINRVSLPAGMRLSEGGIMGLIDGNMYMALDNISAQIYNKMYRYDGANFTAVDMPEGGWTLEYESISEVYGGSMYVQLRNSSANTYNVMYRYDGANFTAVDMPAGGWTLEYSTISEVYGGSMYVQLRNSSANTYNVMYKYDGTNFTAVDMPEGGWTLEYSTISEVYGGSMYVQLRNSSANTYNVMYKYDGANFTAVDMPEGGWTLEYSTSAEVYGGSMYVHLRNSSANTYNVMYKYDGTNFTAVDMPEGWKLSDPSPLEVYGEDMYVSLDNSSANTYGVLHRYNGQVFMDVDLPEGWKFRNYGGGIDIVANTRGLVGTDSGLYLMMDNSSSSDYRALFRIIDPSVSDQSLPVLTLVGADVVSIEVGGSYVDDGVIAVDFLDGDISDRIVVTGAVDTNTAGTYFVTYSATDVAGNVGTATRTVTVEDTTPPAAPTLTGPSLTNSPTPTLTGTAEPGSTVKIYDGVNLLGSAQAESGSYSITVSSLLEGSHNITATATDGAGNESASATLTVMVDTTAPVITLAGDAVVTLEVGGSYTEASATSDGGETVAATGTVNTSEVGTYTITYAATDAAGNVAQQVSRTVSVVDYTKPVISLTGDAVVTIEVGTPYQDQGVTVSDNYDTNLTVTINSSDVDTSVLGSYSVIYSATDSSGNQAVQVTRTVTVLDQTSPVITLVGDAEVTIEMGGTYTEQGATVSDNYYTGLIATPTGSVDTSAEGIYTINYSVTDDSNNTGTATRTVIVDDTTPPTSPGLSGPSLTNSPTPTLTGVAEFGSTVRIYDGANLLGSVGVDENESYSFQAPSLEDGSYGITATATDGAGNVSAASPAITVVVDTTAPDAPTLTGPSSTNSPTPTLTGTAETDSIVRIYEGENQLGSAQAESGSYSITVSSLSDGEHSITATATDKADNVSAVSTTHEVEVDTTPPAAPTLTGPILTNSPTPTLTGTAEPGSTVRIYDGDILLGSVGVDESGSYSAIVSPLSDGSHGITAVVTDAFGNESDPSLIFTVEVDTIAPVITLLSPEVITAEAGFQYIDAGATADGEESVSTEGEVDTSGLGAYLLTYRATDLAGNVGTATRTVTVEDTTKPVIALIGDAVVTIEVGTPYQEPGATVSDNYDTNLNAEIDNGAVNTSVVGDYTVTYNVTDSNSNVAQQVTRTVKVVDTTLPVITLVGGDVTIPLGGTYQELGATVSDNYDTELAVTIDSSTIDTSVVASYTVTYEVTDDSGNMGTAERTVNVVDITPPVITLNGGDVTIEAGGSYDEQGATASDNYYIAGLDVEINSNAVVTSAVGVYQVFYSAKDGSGNEGTTTRKVTVEDTTAPVVTVLPGIDAVVMGASWTDAGAYADGMEDVSTEGSVNTSAVGTYTITYSATDGYNTGTATRTVIVRNSVDSFGDVVIYPNQSTTLIGQVTIEGEAAESGDVVGVYVEDELRGKQEVIIYEGNAWVNMLVNSAGGSETISFKVFDSSTGLTHEKTKSSAVIGQDPFTLGDAENPFMIEMKDFETQTLSLKEGWNLVSFYVEADDMRPETVLAPILNELVQIRGVSASYNPNVASVFNTLTDLYVKDGYWLEVSEDVSFEVEGRVSSGVSIDLHGGWNLVGYPRMNGEDVASELTSLGSTVLQMKSLERSYDPNNPSFLNTLSTIVPGSGYWLNVSGPGTWELGDGGPSFATFKTRSNHSSEQKVGPVWSEPVVYPNLGATVLAEVSIQGKPVAMGSVVGVFVGDELRGRQNVVLHEGNSYVTLNVNLNGEEEVSYRVWNRDDNNEYLVSGTMLLDLGGMYGNPDLVELNGVEVVSKPLQVFNVTSEPFGFSFNTMAGRDYTVEATGDLRTWEAVESFQGSGGEIRFTPRPASNGKRQFFRVYVK